MKLSAEQCETLDREGYLFLPDLFSAEEAAAMRAALPAVFARKGPEIVRECIDPANEFNGPLMFIPRSHKRGRIDAGHDTETTSYPLWTIDNETVEQLVAEGGIVAPKGEPGAALFFHCNLVHASAPNMSPWGRLAVYLSANRVDNAIRRFKRPEYIAHRDFTPIEPLGDDCLLIEPEHAKGAAAQ